MRPDGIPRARLLVAAGIVLALIAFAGNSLLARAAVGGDAVDPVTFTLLRLWSGALMLFILLLPRVSAIRPRGADVVGGLFLALYMAGFSLAYRQLAAGDGALILFAMVQITILGVSWRRGERPGIIPLLGLFLALIGLGVLVRPTPAEWSPGAMLAMAAAGIGWGLYTLNGRSAPNALDRTARSFLVASLLCLPLLLVPGTAQSASGRGIALTILAGAVTSALGYALWYEVVGRISRLAAGTVQLLVPPLTALAAIPLLGEPLTATGIIAGLMIIGGVALTLRPALMLPGHRRRSSIQSEHTPSG